MWRHDFPIFRKNPLVYLDSAATTQKPQPVLDCLTHYYTSLNANVHRGVYPLAEEATARYEEARKRVADFIGAEPEEIIFLRNTTEALNLVAYAFARRELKNGEGIAVTVMEHHSNFVPWQQIAKEKGLPWHVVKITPEGLLNEESLKQALLSGVRLLAITHLSNVLGTLNPIDVIIQKAHDAGVLVVVDAAQSVGHLPIHVKALDVDFLAFSGHKVYGPMSIGVLYGKKALLEKMQPFLYGGEMIHQVYQDHTLFAPPPTRFEAGTPPVADALALGEALAYLQTIGWERIQAHEKKLLAYLYEELSTLPGVKILGPPLNQRMGLVAFTLEEIHPHDLAGFLGEKGICLRAGHHCAQPLHDAFGIPASARASLGIYNTQEDVDCLIQGIQEAQKIFSAGVA